MNNTMKKIYEYLLGNIRYSFFKNNVRCQILSIEDTLNRAIDDNLSISRFGDGELMWMSGKSSASFQQSSPELAKALQKVALCDEFPTEKILLCMPPQLCRLNDRVLRSRLFWRQAIGNNGSEWSKYISKSKLYGNTDISRFYITYRNKSKKVMDERARLWHKLFQDRNLILVEGSATKLGVGSDLFDNALSVSRILVDPRNAFNNLDRIISGLLNYGIDSTSLYLLAIGPTATILAFVLSQYGAQAIDVGHIDVEYIWYKYHARKKTNILGKDVNEAKGSSNIRLSIDEEKYQSEIVLDLRSGAKNA